MHEVKKVAILGAGAMGAYFASRFCDTAGFSTILIADSQRAKKLNQDGIVVNGKPYYIQAVTPDKVGEPVDLIIVALKQHQLKDAIHNLNNLVGDATTFLSIMNGLESEEMIGEIYGMDHVLYGISLGIDAVRVGNQTSFTTPGPHIFGEAKNDNISPKVRRVQEAFERAGIRYQTPDDMIRKLWWKFMVNVGVNQASAVMRAPYGIFQTNLDAQALMETLMQEVVALARASDVNLTDQDIKEWYPILNLLSPQGKTSMLQDIEAQRKTEVDAFSGKVIQLGKLYGVATPVNQTVFRIIRILEQNIKT